jgi:3-demethylubiquinone-9 3-methyltransferase
MAKNTICIWFDRDAEEAALFYSNTFPDSAVGAVHYAPTDFPDGKAGDPLVVEFTVVGIPCVGLNGGPAFKQTEAWPLYKPTFVPFPRGRQFAVAPSHLRAGPVLITGSGLQTCLQRSAHRCLIHFHSRNGARAIPRR